VNPELIESVDFTMKHKQSNREKWSKWNVENPAIKCLTSAYIVGKERERERAENILNDAIYLYFLLIIPCLRAVDRLYS
jgi:hypothetical protein